MKLEINERLQNSIIKSIPKNYNNLEKALFIYNELCLKLTYSLENYINEEKNKKYFLNPDNLKNIDGEKETDVVCYTFNYIFLQMLINANIVSETTWNDNYPLDLSNPTIFKHAHRKLNLNIDGISYKVDSTYGVLDNNDLTLAKYTTYDFNGWSTETERVSDNEFVESHKNITELQKSIKKVRKDCLNLQENANRYYEIKKNEKDFYKISIEERLEMFKNSIKNIPDYSLLSFNYLLKLKHKFFSNIELYKEQILRNIDLLFVKNQKLDEYQAILFVNLNNNTKEFNRNSTQTYLISVKNNNIEKINVNELINLIKTKQLTSRHDDVITRYSTPMINLEI